MVDWVVGSVIYKAIGLRLFTSLEHQGNYQWLIIFPALNQALLPLQVNQAKADGMATITSIFNPEEFLKAQKDDLAIQQVTWALVTNGELGDDVDPEAKLLWRQRQKLHVGTDGILRMWNYAGRSTKSSPLGKKAWQQVIIPKSLRCMFLQLVHDAPVSGHLGLRSNIGKSETNGILTLGCQ